MTSHRELLGGFLEVGVGTTDREIIEPGGWEVKGSGGRCADH